MLCISARASDYFNIFTLRSSCFLITRACLLLVFFIALKQYENEFIGSSYFQLYIARNVMFFWVWYIYASLSRSQLLLCPFAWLSIEQRRIIDDYCSTELLPRCFPLFQTYVKTSWQRKDIKPFSLRKIRNSINVRWSQIRHPRRAFFIHLIRDSSVPGVLLL